MIDSVQWLAMVTTLIAAWMVASKSRRMRNTGFWCFTAGNLLWAIWGWHNGAYALIALQVGLFLLNIRGVKNNETP